MRRRAGIDAEEFARRNEVHVKWQLPSCTFAAYFSSPPQLIRFPLIHLFTVCLYRVLSATFPLFSVSYSLHLLILLVFFYR